MRYKGDGVAYLFLDRYIPMEKVTFAFCVMYSVEIFIKNYLHYISRGLKGPGKDQVTLPVATVRPPVRRNKTPRKKTPRARPAAVETSPSVVRVSAVPVVSDARRRGIANVKKTTSESTKSPAMEILPMVIVAAEPVAYDENRRDIENVKSG
jgi:hypothetical protein